MKLFVDPLGRTYITTSAPSANAVVSDGLLFEPDGRLVLGTPGPNDVWVGGIRVNPNGAACRQGSSVVPYAWNAGIPLAQDPGFEGAIVREADIIPDSIDPFINGGARVDTGLQGLQVSTTVPPIGAQQLLNPDFTTDVSSWYVSNAVNSWVAGVCVVTGLTAGSSNLTGQLIPPQAVQLGCTYYCQARIRNVTSATGPRLRLARGAAGGNALLVASAYVPGTTFTDVAVTFTPRFSDFEVTIQASPVAIGEVFEVEYCRCWLLGP